MGKSLTQLIPKNWLPTKNWEEVSRTLSENNIAIRLRHLNPEIHIVPELTKGAGQGKSISETESIVYHGIATRKGLGMKDFFTVMGTLANLGLAAGVTPTSVQDLKNRYQEADLDISGKYDLDVIVTITKFLNEKSAQAQLLSLQILPTQGFMAMPVPGLENMGIKNLGEAFKSDYYKSLMKSSLPEEQFQQLEEGFPKMQKEMEKVSKQVKEEFEKSKAKTGTQYYQGEYQGFPAVFVQAKNPGFKRYSAPKPAKSSSQVTGMGAGGGFDSYVKLPPRPKVSPPKYIKMCLGLRANNFMISGNLLYTMSSFPPGGTFCHSLTKFRTKIETERIEGMTYRTTHILPVNSTLAREGYSNREEAEKILNKLLTLLKR